MALFTTKRRATLQPEKLPPGKKLAAGYGVVLEIEVMDDVTPGDIFRALNMDEPPTNFVRPEGVRHTSMSVGDIVRLGDVYYLCQSFGWLPFGI